MGMIKSKRVPVDLLSLVIPAQVQQYVGLSFLIAKLVLDLILRSHLPHSRMLVQLKHSLCSWKHRHSRHGIHALLQLWSDGAVMV